MSIILNQGQENIVNQAVDWFYNSSSQVFEFQGEAGTGKSVVLNAIVNRLHLKPNEILPCAFTGQASIVMRLKGFPQARSIHSTFYHVEQVPAEFEESDLIRSNPFMQFNIPKTVTKFVPIPVGYYPNVKLIVIDEGGMVLKRMLPHILKHGIKVLVAGDPGQLPPVGDDPAFLTGENIPELTELMRQQTGNPIIYLARRARRGLDIHCGVYGNKALVIEDKDLTNEMVLSVGNIICGTNKTRDMFNNTIRALKHIETPYPQYGERIICRNNNWNKEIDNIALANGLQGYCISPYNVSNMYDGKYRLDFLPDLLNHPFNGIEIDYKYINSPATVRNQMKNSMKFKNGELFEYAHAITTHLSQGAEYPAAIFYEEFLGRDINDRLKYTGITRAKEYLIYVKKSKKYY